MSQISQTLVFSLQNVIRFAVQASLCTFLKLNELEVACLIAPGLQADLPSRFAPTSGFLSFNLDLPEVLLQAAGPPEGITGYLTDDDAAPQLALMNYQLHQV